MALYNAVNNLAVGNVAWFAKTFTFQSASAPFNDLITLSNGDGTTTQIWGTGLTYNVGTGQMAGTIYYLRHMPASGGHFENIGDGLNPLNISAAVFWQGLPDNAARFQLVFGGTDLIDAGGTTSSQFLGGGAGADQFFGGGGTADTADYRFATAGVTVNWLDGGQNSGEAIGDTFNSIENLWGSGHNDSLTGDNSNNNIQAHFGDDFIDGAGGNDILEGGEQGDRIMAGAGNDTLYGGYSGGDLGAHDVIDFLGAVDPTFSSFGMINFVLGANGDGNVTYLNTDNDIFSGFEHVYGTELIDEITGNAASNILASRGGNDYLRGLGGQDQLWGGFGDDYLVGGADNDTIHGEGGNDIMSFLDPAATSGVSMVLGAAGSGTVTVAGLGTDTYSDIESVEGTNFSDVINGNDVANVLYGADNTTSLDYLRGFGGSDVIAGGGGNDYMTGGTGDDSIYGGDALGDNGTSDWIVFSDATAGISITLNATGSGVVNLAAAGLGTDTYSGIENVSGGVYNDAIYTNNLANIIEGNDGADDLRSFGGDDRLDGGNGNDYLQAGTGNDNVAGGDGDDMMSFYDWTMGITFTLSETGYSPISGIAFNGYTLIYDSIESLSGSDAGAFTSNQTVGADNLTGNSTSNRMWGFWGNDTLSGLAGIDELQGGEGDDVLIGGLGTEFAAGRWRQRHGKLRQLHHRLGRVARQSGRQYQRSRRRHFCEHREPGWLGARRPAHRRRQRQHADRRRRCRHDIGRRGRRRDLRRRRRRQHLRRWRRGLHVRRHR